jgi:uncharacterized membrane protein
VKRFVLWSIASLLVAAIAFVLLAVIPYVPSEEKSYEITDAHVSVELQKDGSLLVHEALEFDFNGSFTGAYRDIPLNGGARISDMQVSEGGREYDPGGNIELGSWDRPGTFGSQTFEGNPGTGEAFDASRRTRTERVVWHYEAADETKTFDLTYRVTGATDVRDDLVDVTWSIWGDQWDFWLDELHADFSAASGVAPTEAWVRPRSVGAEPEIDGDSASVSIDRVASGKQVGMRAIFPRDAISSTRGAEVDPGAGLEQIHEEEAAVDDDYTLIQKLENFVTDNRFIVAAILLLAGVLGVALLAFFARERPVDVPEYLPEPPEDVSPALAFALAREGRYDQRVVLACLLDLVDRGYYDARAAQGKDLDLEVRISENRPEPGKRNLEKYEVATLDFFDRLITGSGWVAIGKMKDEVPKHSSSWRNRWESLNEKLDAAEASQMSWERDLSSWRAILVLVFTLLFAAFTALVWFRTHRLAVPVAGLIATIGLMTAPPSIWFKRLSTESRLRSARWRSFEHWTRDFPRLKDDPPATLKLWRRILVYAVAFGTAERVAKSGRIPAPVAEEAQRGEYWTSYAFYGGSFGSSFNSFGSGFSSQVAPQSSSSGGGGGFSGGGGGGFSGGGGGGAW